MSWAWTPLTHKPFEELTDEEVVEHMHVQDAERVFCVYEALKRGIDHKVIYDITKIDWWFLDKMQSIWQIWKRVWHSATVCVSGAVQDCQEVRLPG